MVYWGLGIFSFLEKGIMCVVHFVLRKPISLSKSSDLEWKQLYGSLH